MRPTFRPASVLLLQRNVVVAAYLLCAAIVPCWSCSKCMHNQFLAVIPDDSNLTIDSVTVHSAELESDAGPVRPVRLAAASTCCLLQQHQLLAGRVRHEIRFKKRSLHVQNGLVEIFSWICNTSVPAFIQRSAGRQQVGATAAAMLLAKWLAGSGCSCLCWCWCFGCYSCWNCCCCS